MNTTVAPVDVKRLTRWCPEHIGIMPLQDTLYLLIVGEYGTENGHAFLTWLTYRQSYYVRKLMTDDALETAEGLLAGLNRLDYSNADCDWRQWLMTYCLEQVPARVWWSYQQHIATLADPVL